MPDATIPPFGELLRTYSFAYTASHDFDVCERVMVEDYVLRMGPTSFTGRESHYKPATERQYSQYPGLGFTVHSFVTNGDRAALCFTEHGRSVKSDQLSSWRGVSLYRWDGKRLVECRVEQDYLSRREQTASGTPHPVPGPGIDPWTGSSAPASADVEASVAHWLTSGAVFADGDDAVIFDDELYAPRARIELVNPVVEMLDLFSAGTQAAFHVRATGAYASGLGAGFEHLVGTVGDLYATGLVTLADSGALTGSIVTDRLSYGRRLQTA